MNTRRYQLLETLPYPRATRAGRLTDAAGLTLHGAYERQIPGGHRAALVNNGTVVHRYDYRSSLIGRPSNLTRSFANLVHTLDPWLVPDDAERPVTNHPASESPRTSGWRPLWHEPIILDSLLTGTKRVGLLAGSPGEVETWASTAGERGFVARRARSWTTWNGNSWRLELITRAGRLADEEDLENLRVEYADQLPAYETGPALARLAALTGEQLGWERLVNPVTADDLLITGFCFGYPVASTAACSLGTHG